MVQAIQSPWSILLGKSLEARFSVNRFEAFANLLAKKNIHPHSFELVKTLFENQSDCSYGVDPLVPLYVECMLKHSWLDGCDLLQSLLQSFQHRGNDLEKLSVSSPMVPSDSKHISPQLEEVLFGLVVNDFASGIKPSSNKEAKRIMKIVVDWMAAVIGIDRAMLLSTESLPQEVFMTRVALGTLMVSLLGHPKVRALFDPMLANVSRSVAEPLNSFIPLLNQISPPLAHRLEFLGHDLITSNFGASHGLGLQVGSMPLGTVVGGPPVLSRAGLLVLLESLFDGWPSLDDTTVLTYIRARYKSDVGSPIPDLITASFDLNNIAVSRGDSQHELDMYHLFLTERLPHLILTLTSETFMPVDIAFLISQAFQRLIIDTSLREEFLFSCTIHGLLSEETFESLLGSKPAHTMPKNGRLVRENVLQEYRKDPSRVEQFVGRLGVRDGNSAVYAEVILEILNHLCTIRDTMSLRGLCNAISCSSDALNAMALFATPFRFLGPICRLLDVWGHEEDQGEYQPVYDEFGSCLLLVMSSVQRFRLKAADLSVLGSTGLVVQLLGIDDWSISSINDLSQDQQKHLSGWVRALFETEGIGDELMSACPPQEFYKIVPTIFNQSIIACRTEILDMDKIKNGLELLLEPFLLPSMVLGVKALIGRAWTQQVDIPIIVRLLKELIVPSSVRSPMHDAVISIFAKDLEHCLLDLRRRKLQIEDVDGLLERLQPTLQNWRGTRPNIDIVTNGIFQLNGNLIDASLTSLSQDLRSLFSWSYGPAGISVIPSYSFKKLHTTLQYNGGTKVLNMILDELKDCMQQSPVISEVSLDIATALICMPDKKSCATSIGAAGSSLSRLTLHAAFLLEQQDITKTGVTDPLRADLITKLYSRLAAYPVNIPSSVDMSAAPMPSLLDSTTDLEPVNSADLAVSQMESTITQDEAAAMSYIPVVQSTFDLEMDAALVGASLDHDDDDVYGSVPQNGDDDIFAGLTYDADMDFS